MFESLVMAPADPILGLTEAFKQDPNPAKVNLGVGVYKDATGATPILQCVKAAESRLLEETKSKTYLSIPGAPAFAKATQQLLFGAASPLIAEKRACTAHCPGGTGALRVASDFIREHLGASRVWVSDPTWANHPAILAAAKLAKATYRYFDAETQKLDFDGMLESLEGAQPGDIVLVHACCHNPSGIDLNAEQWDRLAEFLAGNRLLPLVDFAYQGLADGLEEDAAGLRRLAQSCPEMLVCSSYSKNFSLYNDRVGAFTLVAADAKQAASAFSNVKPLIRTNYSNPPAHGGAIVSTIMGDAQLSAQWSEELDAMRDRINAMRVQFVETLKSRGVDRDFSFICRQKGMFSFSGLNKDQVMELRSKYAIYIVGSGRINVAGMTGANMDYLCDAIASVL